MPKVGTRDAGSSARIPSAWGQAFPRAVRLSPGDLLVPAGTIRVLLRKTGRIEFAYTGYALAGSIDHGETCVVDATALPRRGDLVLCDIDGWGDVRRVVRRIPGGEFLTALDPLPGAHEAVAGSRVLGVVRERRSAARLIARHAFPIWSRACALRYWLNRIRQAPDFGAAAADSIQKKYVRQVEGYQAILGEPLGEEALGIFHRQVPARGRILVAGSGTGREALHLVREGYRVTGFDLVPAMVEASRRNALEAGLEADFFVGDMATLEQPDRRFDAAYITPLVYSFVPGRARRIESLRTLGRHLVPGGGLIYSAHRMRGASDILRAALLWLRQRVRGDHGSEFGDWYTWFLTPEGRLATSYSHRFMSARIEAEARAAGFRSFQREIMNHVVAREFVE